MKIVFAFLPPFSRDPEMFKIMYKMCEFAGVDINKVDFDRSDWYLTHSWTKQKEEQYIEWLTNELLANKEMFRMFTTHTPRNKKNCRSLAEEFTYNSGWKTE